MTLNQLKISEAYLLPAIALMLEAFPFNIINFHSDNGSEYVSGRIADLLKSYLLNLLNLVQGSPMTMRWQSVRMPLPYERPMVTFISPNALQHSSI